MKHLKLVCCASMMIVTPALGQGIKRLTGTAKLLDPATGKELQILKMGDTVNYQVSASNLDAVANKRTTVAYTLSVVPSGSPQPVVLSGRLALTATLAAGVAETKQQAAQYAGTQNWSGSLVVPDYLPEGSATLTMSLTAPGGGAINITKRFKIVSE